MNNSSDVAGEVFTTPPLVMMEGLTASNVLLDRATLNWENVDHYNLRFKESASKWAQIVIAGNLTSKTIYNLLLEHEWQIPACDANDDINNSAFSAHYYNINM